VTNSPGIHTAVDQSGIQCYWILRSRRLQGEQIILPIVFLLLTFGLLMIWRLRGPDGFWQQVSRGLLPGLVVVSVLILRPRLVERTRRLAIPIAIVGLLLPIAAVFFGEVDESGARLALKLGPIPAIQPSELIKLSLVIFLGFIDREEIEGSTALGWLRLPLSLFLGLVSFVGPGAGAISVFRPCDPDFISWNTLQGSSAHISNRRWDWINPQHWSAGGGFPGSSGDPDNYLAFLDPDVRW
jgi:hypothetical protein